MTEADVKRIRRRVRAGEHQTELAVEFGVNRKTIRRRLDELERAETERAERIAEKRLRRQAAREKRKLFERERDAGVSPPIEPSQSSGRSAQKRTPVPNPYFDWLDKPKNLSGRARSEASGFVRAVAVSVDGDAVDDADVDDPAAVAALELERVEHQVRVGRPGKRARTEVLDELVKRLCQPRDLAL